MTQKTVGTAFTLGVPALGAFSPQGAHPHPLRPDGRGDPLVVDPETGLTWVTDPGCVVTTSLTEKAVRADHAVKAHRIKTKIKRRLA